MSSQEWKNVETLHILRKSLVIDIAADAADVDGKRIGTALPRKLQFLITGNS